MTLIIAIKDQGRVWMGGDRVRTLGSSLLHSSSPKIWKKKDDSGNYWVFGSSGVVQLNQIAQYAVPLPSGNPQEAEDLRGHIYTGFIAPLYEALKSAGAVSKGMKNKDAIEGNLLIGVAGRIFYMVDFSNIEVADEYAAIGIGDDAAYCHLDALMQHTQLTPQQRIESSITSAAKRFPGIGGGMDIECA